MCAQKTDLLFLQELKEAEFCELVLVPLLARMDYEDIRYSHGQLEHGKDVFFAKSDPLHGQLNYAAAVKSHKLTGSVSSSRSIREIHFQVSQALSAPFIDPFDGHDVFLDFVYVVTPFPISQIAIASIKDELREKRNRVRFLDGEKILDLISRFYPELLTSDPSDRYMKLLSQRFLEDPALQKLGEGQGLGLLDVYTEAMLSDTTPEEAKYISFAVPSVEKTGRRIEEVYKDHRFLIVLADVGAGKTTLLKKFAVDIGNRLAAEEPGPLPVVIPLSRLRGDKIRSSKNLLGEIERYLQEEEQLLRFVENRLDEAVLLLDGFDEIASGHSRCASSIAALSRKFKNGVIVTSRPSRIPELGQPFHYVRVSPFSDGDMRRFLQAWFPSKPEIASRVLGRLRKARDLESFCRTPLILTLYSILAQRYSVDDLPTRKTEIYQRICELLIGDWDRMRRVKNFFHADSKREVLERLAVNLHEEHKRHFSREAAYGVIREVRASRKIREPTSLMFDELLFRSGLIRRAGRRNYEFVHLSFQEFLCAQRLSRVGDLRVLARSLYEPWWRNVFVFFFGLRGTLDDVPVSKQKRARGRGLRLMEYLAEAHFTSPTTRRTVFGVVAKDLLEAAIGEADLEVCRRMGDEIVEVLRPIAEQRRFKGVLGNYLRIMLRVETESSIDALLKTRRALDWLHLYEVIPVLEKSRVLCGKARGEEFLVRLCRVVSRRLKEPQAIEVTVAKKLKAQLEAFHAEMVAFIGDGTVNAQRGEQVLVLLQESKGRLSQRIRT